MACWGRESPAGTLTGVWLGVCQLPDCKASGKGGPSGLTVGTSWVNRSDHVVYKISKLALEGWIGYEKYVT